MLNAFVPMLFVAIAMFFGILYPLTERRMKDIKAELARRKNEPIPTPGII